MDMIVESDHEALSMSAARWLERRIAAMRGGIAVLATGNTPMRCYALLAGRAAQGDLAARMQVALLDEYLGVPPDDERSLYGWLRRGLLDRLVIDDARVIRFDAMAGDPDAECDRVEQAIVDAGGIEVQLLGLGANGHLGFNEPGSALDAPSRVVDLSPETIASNSRYWGGQDRVPRRALTLGLRLLAQARATLVLVSGTSKARALRAALHGPVSPAVPASILQRMSDVTVLADQEAATGREMP